MVLNTRSTSNMERHQHTARQTKPTHTPSNTTNHDEHTSKRQPWQVTRSTPTSDTANKTHACAAPPPHPSAGSAANSSTSHSPDTTAWHGPPTTSHPSPKAATSTANADPHTEHATAPAETAPHPHQPSNTPPPAHGEPPKRLALNTIKLNRFRSPVIFDHQKYFHGVGGDSPGGDTGSRSEEHTSELQSRFDLVCRLLLE